MKSKECKDFGHALSVFSRRMWIHRYKLKTLSVCGTRWLEAPTWEEYEAEDNARYTMSEFIPNDKYWLKQNYIRDWLTFPTTKQIKRLLKVGYIELTDNGYVRTEKPYIRTSYRRQSNRNKGLSEYRYSKNLKEVKRRLAEARQAEYDAERNKVEPPKRGRPRPKPRTTGYSRKDKSWMIDIDDDIY